MAKESPAHHLSTMDWSKWRKDILFFASVPVTFYVGQVLATVGLAGHVFNVGDLIPNNSTISAVVAYVFSQILNLARKWQRGS